MNPFWFLGASGIAILLYIWILDREKAKAYKLGYDAGYDEGVKHGFKEGLDSKELSWWDDAEKSVDQTRQTIWREERKSGAEEERWP